MDESCVVEIHHSPPHFVHFMEIMRNHGQIMTLRKQFVQNDTPRRQIILGIVKQATNVNHRPDKNTLLVLTLTEASENFRRGKVFNLYAFNKFATSLGQAALKKGDFVAVRAALVEENTQPLRMELTHYHQARVGLPLIDKSKIYFLRQPAKLTSTPPPCNTMPAARMYRYKTISELTEPEQKVNVYGVLHLISKPPTATSKHAVIWIRDETCRRGVMFRVHIFFTHETRPPRLIEGYIMRFHRMKTELFDGVLDGRVFRSSDIVSFLPESDSGKEGGFTTATDFSFEAVDAERLGALRRWIASVREETDEEPQSQSVSQVECADPPATVWIDSIMQAGHYSLLCKILDVQMVSLDPHCLLLTVEDGSTYMRSDAIRVLVRNAPITMEECEKYDCVKLVDVCVNEILPVEYDENIPPSTQLIFEMDFGRPESKCSILTFSEHVRTKEKSDILESQNKSVRKRVRERVVSNSFEDETQREMNENRENEISVSERVKPAFQNKHKRRAIETTNSVTLCNEEPWLSTAKESQPDRNTGSKRRKEDNSDLNNKKKTTDMASSKLSRMKSTQTENVSAKEDHSRCTEHVKQCNMSNQSQEREKSNPSKCLSVKSPISPSLLLPIEDIEEHNNSVPVVDVSRSRDEDSAVADKQLDRTRSKVQRSTSLPQLPASPQKLTRSMTLPLSPPGTRITINNSSDLLKVMKDIERKVIRKHCMSESAIQEESSSGWRAHEPGKKQQPAARSRQADSSLSSYEDSIDHAIKKLSATLFVRAQMGSSSTSNTGSHDETAIRNTTSDMQQDLQDSSPGLGSKVQQENQLATVKHIENRNPSIENNCRTISHSDSSASCNPVVPVCGRTDDSTSSVHLQSQTMLSDTDVQHWMLRAHSEQQDEMCLELQARVDAVEGTHHFRDSPSSEAVCARNDELLQAQPEEDELSGRTCNITEIVATPHKPAQVGNELPDPAVVPGEIQALSSSSFIPVGQFSQACQGELSISQECPQSNISKVDSEKRSSSASANLQTSPQEEAAQTGNLQIDSGDCEISVGDFEPVELPEIPCTPLSGTSDECEPEDEVEAFTTEILDESEMVAADISYIKSERINENDKNLYNIKAWFWKIKPSILKDLPTSNLVSGSCSHCKLMHIYEHLIFKEKMTLCPSCFLTGNEVPVQLSFFFQLYLIDKNNDEVIATVCDQHGIDFLGYTVNCFLEHEEIRRRLKERLLQIILQDNHLPTADRRPMLDLVVAPVHTTTGCEFIVMHTYLCK